MKKSIKELVNQVENLEDKLWDEIAKSIADHMPNQMFPLFKEAFGKEYPKGTSIQLIQTEYPVPSKAKEGKLASVYSDITFLVNGCDLYHIESQIDNEKTLVIRMIEYDFHLALRHGAFLEEPNVLTLFFPHSTVLYPDINKNLPSNLTCRVVFPDGSIHLYDVPTIKIQNYSLEEIREKHLTMFIPFKLLSFKNRIKSKTNPIKENELTDYIHKLIFILKEECDTGNLSQNEYKDYVGYINLAAERVFRNHKDYKQEVLNVTKSVLVMPSDIIREAKRAKVLEQELEVKDKQLEAVKKENDTMLAENEFLRRKLAEAGISMDDRTKPSAGTI